MRLDAAMGWVGLAFPALAAACGGAKTAGVGSGTDADSAVAIPSSSSSNPSTNAAFPSVAASPFDGGCGLDLSTNKPADPLAASCWACISKGCASELAACAAECACNAAISAALTCAMGQSSAIGCFPHQTATFDDAASCLRSSLAMCGCAPSPAPAPSDAGFRLINTGGGFGTLNDGGIVCQRFFRETRGDTLYRAICSCPEAECACFGPSTHAVPILGCPACPMDAPFITALCGFPP